MANNSRSLAEVLPPLHELKDATDDSHPDAYFRNFGVRFAKGPELLLEGHITTLGMVAGCLMLQLGCTRLSDPAVRLAYCLEAAVKEQPRDGLATQASCDLKMPGSYLVVLHPEGALREAQVISAGLPQALLPELRGLRSGVNPAIYVIGTDPGVSGNTSRSTRSSWTTYQMNFVQIDKVMVLTKTTPSVRVDVGGSPGRRVIEAID